MAKNLICALFVAVAAAPAAAHHGLQDLDTTKPVSVRGAISAVAWSNPHVRVVLDVKDAGGTKERRSGVPVDMLEQWTVHLGPPGVMARNDFPRELLKNGAVMSVTGYAWLTDPRSLSAIEMTLPDGRTTRGSIVDFRPIR